MNVNQLMIALTASAVLVCAPIACDRNPAAPAASTASAASRHYTVRGKVIAVSPAGAVSIHHERIDDFIDSKGRTVGMGEMTMAFIPDPGVSASGIAAGEIVSAEFWVNWTNEPGQRIRLAKIEKLPADTAIRLGKPDPAP